MFVFFSFFLHGALKLEGFQRIRDFNAREVIMLVVQVKCKNGSGCMFLRSLFLQKKEIMINSNYYYLWSSNFKISQKCIHFQSLLSSTSLLTSSTECIKRNFRFLWSMTRHTFWTSWIERSTKLAGRRRRGCGWCRWCLLEEMMMMIPVRVCVLLKLLRPEEISWSVNWLCAFDNQPWHYQDLDHQLGTRKRINEWWSSWFYIPRNVEHIMYCKAGLAGSLTTIFSSAG